MIKLESFAMPSNISLSSYHMLNRDMFNSRDMCISPALLDFLEQTLEPFDHLIKATQAANQSAAASALSPNMPMNGSRLALRGSGDLKRGSSLIVDSETDDPDRTDLDETIEFSDQVSRNLSNHF